MFASELKQVAMQSLIDNDVDAPSTHNEHPTDVIRSYLTNAGSKFFGLRSARREQPEPTTVHDLWDYRGDFA
jgi:hypothetical protein